MDDEARRRWRSGQNRSALQAEKRFWEPQESRGAEPLIFFCFIPRLLILRSTVLAFMLWFCFCSVAVAFLLYCPVRAALTFVGCDKSKQKRA
ncbi:MAG: hypothetical protein IJ349_03275, partial [Clostridia bacterium]|nr:hypothetical protein [Clostridia bacterium]